MLEAGVGDLVVAPGVERGQVRHMLEAGVGDPTFATGVERGQIRQVRQAGVGNLAVATGVERAEIRQFSLRTFSNFTNNFDLVGFYCFMHCCLPKIGRHGPS